MAIFAPHHGFVGKTTQKQVGTSAMHIRYITRPWSASRVMGEHMPTDRHQARTWMDEREAADRKNGRVCDKLMLPLPLELDPQERVELVRDLMREIGGGRIAWLAAIHDQGKDANNPHAHVVLRDKDHETGKRVFGTSEKGSTERIRELWETAINTALERIGSQERVDRRSLADQGIAREAGIHVGPNVLAMEERGLRPVSIAQDHTTSRGNERVVDWPEIDQGRTRADRQREIEAHNREREAGRGKEKGEQQADHVPAQVLELVPPAPAIEREADRASREIAELSARFAATDAALEVTRTQTAQPRSQAPREPERAAEPVRQVEPVKQPEADRDQVAAILRGLDDRSRDITGLIPTPQPQRQAQAAAREKGGMDVEAPSREAAQRPSYEVAIPRQQVELRLERSRLVNFVLAGRDKLAGLAHRLDQAFQVFRDRQQIRVEVQQPEKPARDPGREIAAAADPWAAMIELGRKIREQREAEAARHPQPEKDRAREDRGRSMFPDYSRGRERKGPGF